MATPALILHDPDGNGLENLIADGCYQPNYIGGGNYTGASVSGGNRRISIYRYGESDRSLTRHKTLIDSGYAITNYYGSCFDGKYVVAIQYGGLGSAYTLLHWIHPQTGKVVRSEDMIDIDFVPPFGTRTRYRDIAFDGKVYWALRNTGNVLIPHVLRPDGFHHLGTAYSVATCRGVTFDGKHLVTLQTGSPSYFYFRAIRMGSALRTVKQVSLGVTIVTSRYGLTIEPRGYVLMHN